MQALPAESAENGTVRFSAKNGTVRFIVAARYTNRTGGRLFFPGRDFLPLLTRFRQADGDCLLSTLDLAASAGGTASRRSALEAVHLALHIGT